MKDIDEIYEKIAREGILLFNYAECDVPAAIVRCRSLTGIYVNDRLLPTKAEEKRAVMHEYAHYKTGACHAPGASELTVARDEYRANKYAVHELLPFRELCEAFASGYTEPYELAEYFELPEDFVHTAIYMYRCEGKL